MAPFLSRYCQERSHCRLRTPWVRGSCLSLCVNLSITGANMRGFRVNPRCNPACTLNLSVILLHNSPLSYWPHIDPKPLLKTSLLTTTGDITFSVCPKRTSLLSTNICVSLSWIYNISLFLSTLFLCTLIPYFLMSVINCTCLSIIIERLFGVLVCFQLRIIHFAFIVYVHICFSTSKTWHLVHVSFN